MTYKTKNLFFYTKLSLVGWLVTALLLWLITASFWLALIISSISVLLTFIIHLGLIYFDDIGPGPHYEFDE